MYGYKRGLMKVKNVCAGRMLRQNLSHFSPFDSRGGVQSHCRVAAPILV